MVIVSKRIKRWILEALVYGLVKSTNKFIKFFVAISNITKIELLIILAANSKDLGNLYLSNFSI